VHNVNAAFDDLHSAMRFAVITSYWGRWIAGVVGKNRNSRQISGYWIDDWWSEILAWASVYRTSVKLVYHGASTGKFWRRDYHVQTSVLSLGKT